MARRERRVTRRAAVLGLCVLASVALGVGLRAATTQVNDPNDTDGLLDVEMVRVVREPGEYPRWSVRTFAVWTLPDVWDRGYVSIEFDTRFGPDPDFYVLIRSLGTRLEGTLFRYRPAKPNDLVVSRVKVGRGRQDAVTVRVPLGKLVYGNARTEFGWWVLTTFTGDRCPASCFDRVPNEGAELIRVPGTSPSPTPTSTSSSTTPPPTTTGVAPPPGD
jgi:hypothetical protein